MRLTLLLVALLFVARGAAIYPCPTVPRECDDDDDCEHLGNLDFDSDGAEVPNSYDYFHDSAYYCNKNTNVGVNAERGQCELKEFVGGACKKDSDCFVDSCNQGRCRPSDYCYEHVLRYDDKIGKKNHPCDFETKACDAGLVCDGLMCVEPAAENEHCNPQETSMCAAGLTCTFTYVEDSQDYFQCVNLTANPMGDDHNCFVDWLEYYQTNWVPRALLYDQVSNYQNGYSSTSTFRKWAYAEYTHPAPAWLVQPCAEAGQVCRYTNDELRSNGLAFHRPDRPPHGYCTDASTEGDSCSTASDCEAGMHCYPDATDVATDGSINVLTMRKCRAALLAIDDACFSDTSFYVKKFLDEYVSVSHWCRTTQCLRLIFGNHGCPETARCSYTASGGSSTKVCTPIKAAGDNCHADSDGMDYSCAIADEELAENEYPFCQKANEHTDLDTERVCTKRLFLHNACDSYPNSCGEGLQCKQNTTLGSKTCQPRRALYEKCDNVKSAGDDAYGECVEGAVCQALGSPFGGYATKNDKVSDYTVSKCMPKNSGNVSDVCFNNDECGEGLNCVVCPQVDADGESTESLSLYPTWFLLRCKEVEAGFESLGVCADVRGDGAAATRGTWEAAVTTMWRGAPAVCDPTGGNFVRTEAERHMLQYGTPCFDFIDHNERDATVASFMQCAQTLYAENGKDLETNSTCEETLARAFCCRACNYETLQGGLLNAVFEELNSLLNENDEDDDDLTPNTYREVWDTSGRYGFSATATAFNLGVKFNCAELKIERMAENCCGTACAIDGCAAFATSLLGGSVLHGSGVPGAGDGGAPASSADSGALIVAAASSANVSFAALLLATLFAYFTRL